MAREKKYAMCFGGFCPMHQGHLDVIMRAKKENDVCIIIVCGYKDEPRANELNMSLEKRLEIIRGYFRSDEQIRVIGIDDDELGIDQSLSIGNWTKWVTAFRDKIEKEGICPKNQKMRIYVAESLYKDRLEELGEDVVLMERINPISGTMIRKERFKCWNKILLPFRKYMTYNILVLGTASEGKSTLVRDISTYFGMPYVEEYGRRYMEMNNKTDLQLTENDFLEFLEMQVNNCKEAMDITPNGMIISDTDAAVTMMYAREYAMSDKYDLTEASFDHVLVPEAERLSREIKWDVIFFLTPANEFVDDGIRNMLQSSMEERMKNKARLEEYVRQYYPETPVIYLRGGEYLKNFETVKDHINGVMR